MEIDVVKTIFTQNYRSCLIIKSILSPSPFRGPIFIRDQLTVGIELNLWYAKGAPRIEVKQSKSILHPFIVRHYKGLTINPYQGCHHRCGYCYATYEWSPEFYEKTYSKSNAPEVLENQLKRWKAETIEPVMVSSATDAYQPAEVKLELTRKCIKVLQKYNAPYYIFTKSTLISRDLELHKQYKDNCFLVWSITTCQEKIRRIIEPGTPPAYTMFATIKKFSDAGVRCGVNIDPIIPFVTDLPDDFEVILDYCLRAGIRHVFGAILRLRADIWERMKTILSLLKMTDRIHEYNRIYNIIEPLESGHNITADGSYSKKTLENLREMVLRKGISFDFPALVASKCLKNKNKEVNKLDTANQQLTLMSYM
jgi:DNA repair photolyase